ncbi:MAG: hypothetical protein U1D30_25595 [Planctomycetota bacterium]
MNQPTFEDGPPVPMMVEGTMDEATLRQFFADLGTHATIEAIREKNSLTANSAAGAPDLPTLLDQLLARETRAAQIRYTFDSHAWTDSLFATPQGFKVVRCRHDQ